MFLEALKKARPRSDDGSVNVFVETPNGSRHKYDIDASGLFRIALELPQGVAFPASFGFVPNTIAPDGDALDVILLTAGTVPAGALIESRIIGVLKMENDEGGEMKRNDRVVAVAKMSRYYGDKTELSELSPGMAWDIEEFFETYNEMIERPFKIVGRGDAAEAMEMLETAERAARGET